MSLNIMKTGDKYFVHNLNLFYQPSVMNCIKVVPKSCKLDFSTDDVYEQVCDKYAGSGKELVNSIIELSVTNLKNPDDFMGAIQTCRKLHIKTFSLPF